MLKWLVLAALALGIADPILIIMIWSRTSFSVAAMILLVVPFVLTWLAALSARRPAGLAAMPMLFAARLMAWYPGVICKTLALFLILPPVQAWVTRIAMRQMLKSMGGGNVFMGRNMGGFPDLGVNPFPGAGEAPPPPNFGKRGAPGGGLKRTDGRVIDNPNPLPKPDDENPERKRR